MDTKTKTKPVPTRFAPEEDAFLHAASRDTGLSLSELVRRSVRLLKKEKQTAKGYAFILELSA